MPEKIVLAISLMGFLLLLAILQLAMAKEADGVHITYTNVHINLTEQTITFKKENEVVATLVFEGKLPAEGVIFLPNQPQALLDSPFDEEVETPVSPAAPAKEREETATLSGRLKSKPKSGRNDRSGKPTAYADFAAHVEGEEKAHYYKATFHRHTRNIALKLPVEAQITVFGYPHPRESDKSTDTFSVVNMVDYPGKPPLRPKKR
jgi:hypothetical protein